MGSTTERPIQLKEFISLMRLYRPSLWLLGLALFLVLMETALSLAVPLLTMNLVDITVESNFSGTTAALIAGVFIVQIILSGISMYMMIYIGQIMVAKLRKDLWHKVLRLPVSFYDQNSSGETMSRITHDTNVIKNFFTDQLIPFLSGTIKIIGSIIILFALNWSITLLLLLIVPVSLAVLKPLGRKTYKVSKALQDETASFQGDLGRVLSDIRLVKSSIAEDPETSQGNNRIDQLLKHGLDTGKIMAIISPLMTTITLLVLVVVFGYGGIQVANGTLSAGTLVAIVFYMFQIIPPISQMGHFFTQLQKAKGATERITYIMEENLESQLAASVSYPHNQETVARVNGIRFSNVSFSYPNGSQILKKVSFSANASEVTAIVGPSGAGKTTLFSLIERFYPPSEGSIEYDNQPINDFDVQEWRQKIAYVAQDSPLMAGTIRYNLTYGHAEKSSDADIHAALEKANLTSFITSLPNGLETEVGERGILVSGGQRQRLAIARAILRNPQILLLDEATAHLDSHSEFLVQEALNQLMLSRTTLVIAHRLSTVQHADKLVVVQSGEITGEGTHDELIEHHQFYRELVDRQLYKKESPELIN
ncbi:MULTISPECIES: ABC transporter ATP-binding protein [Shouchella]|uniref:ABC transporter ATP-binding protein n=1 Tax=Shouchella TaxID=2893057 RepID=UPI00079B569F|nr:MULTISPECIES: ABC transporter ATP-binding protein [Shouchella]KKI86110.1 multidrug ABC transporter permease [Shouchella clausii]MCM3310902.1 ABC transporter ATP-binding protein/permease [Psychrobacillus sp. MER TA 17]MCM3378669.1 ABC transporter ATP-binding protein/permease [Shouchella rhizosphaerae]PAD47929.1 ABC transporter ATP-binding protein [Shouchella clausii]